MTDAHVQHTWTLTHPDRDPISVELWTDGYTVRVDGGPDDGLDDERGRSYVEGVLLPRYEAAGWRLERAYAVNDPADHTADDEAEDGPDLDTRPDVCPMCGSVDFEHVPNHATDFREGEAWLCLGPSCSWGRYVTA